MFIACPKCLYFEDVDIEGDIWATITGRMRTHQHNYSECRTARMWAGMELEDCPFWDAVAAALNAGTVN